MTREVRTEVRVFETAYTCECGGAMLRGRRSTPDPDEWVWTCEREDCNHTAIRPRIVYEPVEKEKQ